MSNSELLPAIKLFEQKVDEAERKANELLNALNMMREAAGLPPRVPGGGSGGEKSGAIPMQIKNDTFFGRPQQTAVREYLEMRKAQGDGPATPREIYDALVAGGYTYSAKDAETALVGLRALLRKRTNVFVKVGNAYGLTAWYPNVKQPKAAAKGGSDDDEDEDDAETETTSSDKDEAAA